ncbi:hypothetical protein BCF33_0517 [Hasllibacter halocynthiae]|uniref:Alpha/beta hydrolase n=1 Tax=Hasllibacter halocynthiae TaxID=595589 RepID=A0A2T0X7R2_9RHOB|nr:alpha/beta hydrolase [Hasllibacter halocynthiae]PRY94914.1 hypothetical protein BCF33_0517 [Hasllibacter halocynthiae]
MSDPAFVALPDLGGPEPAHWLTAWSEGPGDWRMVAPPDPGDPDPGEWRAALSTAISDAGGPVAVIAHGLGCLVLAGLAEGAPAAVAPVVGALLAAPPDAAQGLARPAVARFGTGPEGGGPWGALPFPAVVAASQSDPWCDYARAAALARAWDAPLADMGAAGHLGAADGYREWPEGEALMGDLLAAARLVR